MPDDQPTIQAGIDAASDDDVVMVADGTYTGLGNKDIDFKGNKITVQSENGPVSCIIDCEGTGRGFQFENFETNESVLSGFTIRNANWDDGYIDGGGIQCSSSAPKITNCIIENCRASQWGGGINIFGSLGGEGIPIISNSIIVNNYAGYVGGGISVSGIGGNAVVINCTIAGNDASTRAPGFALGNGGYATIVNSIFWNASENEEEFWSLHAPPSVTYSLIKGGFAGEGNIACDPLVCDPGFVNPLIGDYRLIADSPCIDTGNNSVPQISASDIEGNQRIIDGDGDGTATVDMGAYEYVLQDTDTDADGLPDTLENSTGTNPFDDDTDNDGLLDGPGSGEDVNANGVVDPGETDPRNIDTDGDGIQDGTEKSLIEPEGSDTDMTLFLPDQDPSTATDPLNQDTDGDGIMDGEEDLNKNGKLDEGETSADIFTVAIDIKPGSYPNSINLGSNGVIPVAILTSASFDATTVDPSTVELGGSGVAVRGKGKSLAHEEDVNGDGLIDLLVQVETENFDPEAFQDGYIILTGNTYDETPIQGSDEIVIVPNGG